MIVRNGLVAAWLLGKDVDSTVRYVYVGSPLGDDELMVATGDEKLIKNDPGDVVAQTLGFRGHVDQLNINSHDFINSYINKYGDAIKDHLLKNK